MEGVDEYVTAMQERAFEIIRHLPDDKVYYVIKMLEGIEGLVPKASVEVKTDEQKAYENLQRFRKCSEVDIDYKTELARALEENESSIEIYQERKKERVCLQKDRLKGLLEN